MRAATLLLPNKVVPNLIGQLAAVVAVAVAQAATAGQVVVGQTLARQVVLQRLLHRGLVMLVVWAVVARLQQEPAAVVAVRVKPDMTGTTPQRARKAATAHKTI